jgi:hypothetical protein
LAICHNTGERRPPAETAFRLGMMGVTVPVAARQSPMLPKALRAEHIRQDRRQLLQI